MSNYRLRGLDVIPFQRPLTFDLEVWHWQDVDLSLQATSFWCGR